MEAPSPFPGEPAPLEPSSEHRIRDAALKTFATHGIAVTSLRTVAGAAGVSIGLVQHYFRDQGRADRRCRRPCVTGDRCSNGVNAIARPAGRSTGVELGHPVTSLIADHPDVVDYLGRALVEGDAVGSMIFDGLVRISAAERDELTEHQLVRPGLDRT